MAATTFLTRIPLPARLRLGDDDLLRSVVLFPVVGAALGAGVGWVGAVSTPLLPAVVAGALGVGFELVATGALHLDGLADSADGLGGGSRQQRLAIMRDHGLGVYGASTLVLNLLAKAAAVGTLATLGMAVAVPVLALVFAVSRATPLPLAATLPYARPGGGTGMLLAGRLGPRRAVCGVAVALVLVAALGAVVGVATASGAVVSAVVATVCVGLASWRRLGGVTGDVLGAAI
ncbi:MAG: adenosylcobinamide-GDP ribazoletransferase, partial [Nocardioidaceae bacterium]